VRQVLGSRFRTPSFGQMTPVGPNVIHDPMPGRRSGMGWPF
jgi:hypothetical protein